MEISRNWTTAHFLAFMVSLDTAMALVGELMIHLAKISSSGFGICLIFRMLYVSNKRTPLSGDENNFGLCERNQINANKTVKAPHRIINLFVKVYGSDSLIDMCVYNLFRILFHYRLLQDITIVPCTTRVIKLFRNFEYCQMKTALSALLPPAQSTSLELEQLQTSRFLKNSSLVL
ncbi:hypothetical protein MG293_001460 [Ovis ammon polii]|uniref:Uncharacterized protein n=1 Tax=Ovis ammon polii TaxID=230172 RepID=A0AAD4YFN0_OVIAM|nr:hypothetical protein MG293_001460 [Ovis ammon polii]